jgi:peroxiredoxin
MSYTTAVFLPGCCLLLLGLCGIAQAADAVTPATGPSGPSASAASTTPGPPKRLNSQELFAILDQVQNILANQKIPRDGTAKPEDVAPEKLIIESAVARSDNPTGEAAQAGYIMHASLEAMCGHYAEAERQLRLVIQHGTGQAPLAAFKEVAEILLQQQRAQALDELADQAEAAKVPQELANHIRMLANFLHIKTGEAFPLFTLTDTAGSTHTLSDYQGHVLLLDFWAIWCKPCVTALPGLLHIYSTYHPRGLDLLGVSLDDNPRMLAGFIQQTGISWPQVIQGQGFNSPICEKYGVWGLPANFLIAPDGTLLAKNLHGEDLDKALAKLIKP